MGGSERGYGEGPPKASVIDGGSWFYHSLLHWLRILEALCAQQRAQAAKFVENCPQEVGTQNTFVRIWEHAP